MPKQPRPTISTRPDFYDRARNAAFELGVSISSFVEVVTARSIGIADEQLPPAARRAAARIPATFETTKRA